MAIPGRAAVRQPAAGRRPASRLRWNDMCVYIYIYIYIYMYMYIYIYMYICIYSKLNNGTSNSHLVPPTSSWPFEPTECNVLIPAGHLDSQIRRFSSGQPFGPTKSNIPAPANHSGLDDLTFQLRPPICCRSWSILTNLPPNF